MRERRSCCGFQRNEGIAARMQMGKISVGWGHVPTGAGTAECVRICSFVLSAASRTARRRARRLGAPVQELPNAHQLVRLYCLPLRGRHAVGRDDSARRCRNCQMRTNSFVCTVCRFADGTPSGRALRMWNAPYGVLLPNSKARISESKVLDLTAYYGSWLQDWCCGGGV